MILPSGDSIFVRAARRTNRVLKQWTTPVPPQRHENPYATLLPILTALGAKFDIRQVLEFGCGHNSTLNFLNRKIFPSVERLVSVENDSHWGEVIEKEANDARLQMMPVNGAVADCVTSDLVFGCQLVLVDDSTCAQDRAATVRAVANVLPQQAILVVHDFEVPEYQQASADLPHRFVCDALLPNTGVLSNGAVISEHWFRRVNQIIRKHANCISPTDTLQWRQKMSNI